MVHDRQSRGGPAGQETLDTELDGRLPALPERPWTRSPSPWRRRRRRSRSRARRGRSGEEPGRRPGRRTRPRRAGTADSRCRGPRRCRGDGARPRARRYAIPGLVHRPRGRGQGQDGEPGAPPRRRRARARPSAPSPTPRPCGRPAAAASADGDRSRGSRPSAGNDLRRVARPRATQSRRIADGQPARAREARRPHPPSSGRRGAGTPRHLSAAAPPASATTGPSIVTLTRRTPSMSPPSTAAAIQAAVRDARRATHKARSVAPKSRPSGIAQDLAADDPRHRRHQPQRGRGPSARAGRRERGPERERPGARHDRERPGRERRGGGGEQMQTEDRIARRRRQRACRSRCRPDTQASGGAPRRSSMPNHGPNEEQRVHRRRRSRASSGGGERVPSQRGRKPRPSKQSEAHRPPPSDVAAARFPFRSLTGWRAGAKVPAFVPWEPGGGHARGRLSAG